MELIRYRRELIVAVLLLAVPTFAAEGPPTSSGFLSDYSLLKPAAQGQVGTWIYVAPNAVEKLRAYHATMVDQPVLSIAPDSKYQGIKPDDAKLIADTFRKTFTDELAKGYSIVEQPGMGVLAVRTAFSNVYLEKKGRGLLGYTPVGFVVTTAKGAMLDDVMDKVKLAQVVVEAELLDSSTGQVLAEVVDERGSKGDKKAFTSWKEVDGVLTTYAKRLKCNLDNARLAPHLRQDCTSIVEPVDKAADKNADKPTKEAAG